MLLAEPPRTAYDLHFRLLGIPVRITPFFWVASVLLGWNLAQGFSAQSQGELSVGVALIIWTLAVLLSILVHEFGHALAFRLFGVESDVVLYHFGGLAIPQRALGFSAVASRGRSPKSKSSFPPPVHCAQLVVGRGRGEHLLCRLDYVVPNPLPFIPQTWIF